MNSERNSRVAAIRDRLSWIYLLGDESDRAKREVAELRRELRHLTKEEQ